MLGGFYVKDFDANVTHLLIGGDFVDMDDEEARSDKFKHALDLNKARQRERAMRKLSSDRGRPVNAPKPQDDIKIVWAEWYWDSIATTGQYDFPVRYLHCVNQCYLSLGRYPEGEYTVERPRPVPKDPPRRMSLRPLFGESYAKHPNHSQAPSCPLHPLPSPLLQRRRQPTMS